MKNVPFKLFSHWAFTVDQKKIPLLKFWLEIVVYQLTGASADMYELFLLYFCILKSEGQFVPLKGRVLRGECVFRPQRTSVRYQLAYEVICLDNYERFRIKIQWQESSQKVDELYKMQSCTLKNGKLSLSLVPNY